MSVKTRDLGMTPLDDLFSTDESRAESQLEKVVTLNPAEISDFPNHPFKVKQDEAMAEMVESVRKYGVLVPALVRPKADGGYEMVAGHRRKFAATLAELPEIPCIVRDLTDDEATIIMVDSNLQRETILPSEKAFAYKLKLEAMSHQGHRSDLTSDQVGRKLETAEMIAQQSDDSKSQVRRYIRLTHLIPELLTLMDENKMALSVGVELSFLDEQSQRNVLEQCEINDCTPSYAQAVRMRKAFSDFALTADVIRSIMSEEKANQRETVKIPTEKLRKFAPNANPQQLEDFVLKACEHYRKYLRRQRDAR